MSHECIDDQDYNDSTENDQPIGNLTARYRGFLVKPFHGFSSKIGRLSLQPLCHSPLPVDARLEPNFLVVLHRTQSQQLRAHC